MIRSTTRIFMKQVMNQSDLELLMMRPIKLYAVNNDSGEKVPMNVSR